MTGLGGRKNAAWAHGYAGAAELVVELGLPVLKCGDDRFQIGQDRGALSAQGEDAYPARAGVKWASKHGELGASSDATRPGTTPNLIRGQLDPRGVRQPSTGAETPQWRRPWLAVGELLA